MRAASPRSLVGKKNLNSCCGAGPEPRTAKDKWCCSLEKPVSANPGSRQRCLKVSPLNRTRAYVISAPRSALTAFELAIFSAPAMIVSASG